MIRSLVMKAGARPGEDGLSIELTPMTVFVGPNNGGKSRALQEIAAWVERGEERDRLVVRSIELDDWSEEQIDSLLASMEVASDARASPRAVRVVGLDPLGGPKVQEFDRQALKRQAANPRAARQDLRSLLGLSLLRLDGASRLALTRSQGAGDLKLPASTHLGRLFQDNASRAELSSIVHDAFGKFLVVDPTNMGTLQLRLAARPPEDEAEERNWDSRAVAFQTSAVPIEDGSDGLKAFIGILLAVVAGRPRVVVLDEPEAFLHPSLCSRLGAEITRRMQGGEARTFVATHSASFLMGCIQAGAEVSIVRLTYDYTSATARLLPRDRLLPLMRNPLLRSVGVLNALFHSSVVVTEGDSDRAFYQEINERLLSYRDPRAIAGCLFLNAQNKQTIWDIVCPLRDLGIPAVGIVDLDVLKEGGKNWAKVLEGAGVPELSRHSIGVQRSSLMNAFKATGRDLSTEGGIALLSPSDQESCRNLLDQLADYGVFVVEAGELQSWMPALGVSTEKSRWLTSIFEAMGEDPSHPEYTRPDVGDVWDFLGRVKSWIVDASRKGVPQ